MNKTIIVMISIIVILGAILTAIAIFRPSYEQEEQVMETKVAEIEILDECTDEYEVMTSQEFIETDSNQEKISPNCAMILKTHFLKCNHIIQKYSNISNDLVNKTENELKEIYNEWTVEKFASNEVVLCKECEGFCGEHYVVRDKEGQVVIYEVLESGEEVEMERTDIATDYLTEVDKIDMRNGMEVFGKDNLNQLIEDFE